MRWSQTLIPTLKESPAEAEILSHKLLLRAGLVRKLAGGLYTFLPLGVRVLRKIENIIREEMDRSGALEILMPALQPPEIWKTSGRYETAKDVLYKVKDRANREYVLGPTHEEVVTLLAASEISSYRQMPRNFYQIQTKFRDEIRPRFGLMRAKEFIMKDAYSFDATDSGATESYQRMYDAYTRIFQRCGLRAMPVEADTGVIGGKHSHEFMVPAETGENEVAFDEEGGYAANIEKAVSRLPEVEDPAEGSVPQPEAFETPGVRTIRDLEADPYQVPADRQIKTLVLMVEDSPLIVLLRGDHDLNEFKLAAHLGTQTFRQATESEIEALLGARPGSLGAVGALKAPVLADVALQGRRDMATGANRDGFHLRHVDVARDISVREWVDLRLVREGEASPTSGNPLKICRAIEVGHVFKLGTKYSEAMEARFLDDQGKLQPAIMGCYGIGVTRTLQAVIEQCSDENGILWPLSVAPYQVCITTLDIEPGPVMEWAEKLHDELSSAGVDVILDDRKERPGVKFKDSELVGFPIRIGLGARSLAEGLAEIKPRGGELIKVPVEEVLNRVLERVRQSS